MDWAGIIAIKPVEEKEMSRLAAKFATRVHKWATCSKGEFTPIFDRKGPKRSSPDEKA